METPQVVVAVIVTNGSALLLGRDAKTGRWTLPKGGVLKFQELQTVGRTAVAETTGIAVEVTGSIFISEDIVPPEHNVVVVALGKLLGSGDALKPVARLDVFSEVRWVDFRELGDIQHDIDSITTDAIMKFGLYMQAKMQEAR